MKSRRYKYDFIICYTNSCSFYFYSGNGGPVNRARRESGSNEYNPKGFIYRESLILESKDEIKSSLFFRKLSDPQHKIKR